MVKSTPHIVHTITPSGNGTATSHASRVDGGWLKAQAQTALPQVHQEFDKSRDPLIAKQLADRDKTESQRRGEQDSSEGGASKGWLKLQQQQAMAAVPRNTQQNAPQRNAPECAPTRPRYPSM